jgi:hypothetical protein
MELYLRKVRQPDNYRVILKTDDGDVELGSIGIQYHTGADPVWIWTIDTVLPMREIECHGQGMDRADCMKWFKAAWIRFAADEANLAEFLNMKRRR